MLILRDSQLPGVMDTLKEAQKQIYEGAGNGYGILHCRAHEE